MQKHNKKKRKKIMKKYVKEKFDEKNPKIMMPFQPVQPICDSTRTLPS